VGWNFDSVLHVGIMGEIKEASDVLRRPARSEPSGSRLRAADFDVLPLRLVNRSASSRIR